MQKTFVIGGSGLDGTDDGFVAEVNPSLSGSASLVYSTYLGNGVGKLASKTIWSANGGLVFSVPGPAIAVDGSGDAYVTGYATSTSFPTTSGAYEKSVGGAA